MPRPAPIRVTHVVFDLDGGGLETLVGQMARRTAGTAVVTSIVTLSGRVGRVGSAVRDLVDQYHVLRPVPLASMVLPAGLTRAIRATRADVVHLHSGAWLKPARAARAAGVRRVVYTEHGREHADSGALRWLDRLAARRTDAVVSVSDRLAKYLREVVGVAESLVRTIPNGVDAEWFSPGPVPADLWASLDLSPGARVIGSIGRLERVKGYERLIESFATLRRLELDTPVYLVLAGDGSQRPELEQLARDLGVSDGVRFAGWTDRAVDFYRLFDVFALTSLSEGLSVSLLEAMACGAVPVVTDVGANAEVLGPSLAGQVIQEFEPAGFAAVLAAALSEPGRRDKLGQVARRRVLERYTLDGMMQAYERIYRGEA